MKHILIIIFLVFSINSCSNFGYKIGYNNLNGLLLDRIDSYFDLKTTQKRIIQNKLQLLHKWHRKQELPQYRNILSKLQSRIQRGLIKNDYIWLFKNIRRGWIRIMNKTYKDSIWILSDLQNDQIEYCAKKFQKNLKELKEELDSGKIKRKVKRYNSFIKIMEYFYDDLSDYQKNIIKTKTASMIDFVPFRYRFYKKRYAQFLNILKERNNHITIKNTLNKWMLKTPYSYPYYYRSAMKKMRTQSMAIYLAIDKSASPDQRLHAKKKLLSLIALIKDLEKG